jgi:uncharacterized protein YhfF
MKVFRKFPGIFKSMRPETARLDGHTGADSSLSYWNQRHRIFSKYDDGVWLTDDSWFGVTPEPVAKCVFLLYVFSILK